MTDFLKVQLRISVWQKPMCLIELVQETVGLSRTQTSKKGKCYKFNSARKELTKKIKLLNKITFFILLRNEIKNRIESELR